MHITIDSMAYKEFMDRFYRLEQYIETMAIAGGFSKWIDEKTAAMMVNRSPKTLRRFAKTGRWKIDYTAPNGRRYMYSKKSIEKFLLENSSVVTKA